MSISVLLEPGDELLERLYRCMPEPDFVRLFDTTTLQMYADQSPIWLEVEPGSALFEQLHNAPEQWPGLIIHSPASRDVLLGHLRHILYVRFERTRIGVLRYWSPTTASYFFTVGPFIDFYLWMGPITRLSWYGGTWPQRAEGRERRFCVENPLTTWHPLSNPRPMHLDERHEQALQRQKHERFVWQWWQRQDAVSFSDAVRGLEEGLGKGLTDPLALEQHLDALPDSPIQTFQNGEPLT